MMTDAGLILLASVSDIDLYELDMLKSLNRPQKTIVVMFAQNDLPTDKADLILKSELGAARMIEEITEYLLKATEPDPEFII